MPVEGLPDIDQHRFCFKCHKWFDEAEGQEILPPTIRPPGFEFARNLFGYRRTSQFICDACRQSRRKGRIRLFAVAAFAVLLAAAYRLFVHK